MSMVDIKRMCICVYGRNQCGFTNAALKLLTEYRWPFRYNCWDGRNKDEHFQTIRQITKKDTATQIATFPRIVVFASRQDQAGGTFAVSDLDSSEFIARYGKCSKAEQDKIRITLEGTLQTGTFGCCNRADANSADKLFVEDFEHMRERQTIPDGSSYLICNMDLSSLVNAELDENPV